jgi:hypothetical protein
MWDADLEATHLQATRGAALIERQRALIDDLRVSGHADLAEKAEEILHSLLIIQAERIVLFHKLMNEHRAQHQKA